MRDELKKANAPPAEDKHVNSAALKNILLPPHVLHGVVIVEGEGAVLG